MDPILLLTSALVGIVPIILKFIRDSPEFSVFWNFLQRTGILDILQKFGVEIPKAKGSYEERMAKLIAKFHEVTSETDTIVSELENSVIAKASRVKELEEQHENLRTRIETLKQSPQYANLQTQAMLEKFIQEQGREGRRSAWRDYGLFILGVVTPFLVNWGLSRLGIQLTNP